MIKKSVFEDDLINGMQRELRTHEKKQGMSNLVKAAEYLHSAIEIFEEAGMHSKADQLLKILEKIASRPESAKIGEVEWGSMPELEDWMKHGVTMKDLKEFRHDRFAKAKINKALRDMGFPEDKIVQLLGIKGAISEQEVEELLNPQGLGKINQWFDDPSAPLDPQNVQPGEEIRFKSVSQDMNASKQRNPAKVSDRHTKGLTPEKMVQNIKHHGHPLNLSDDASADDLLNIDIDDKALEVTEGDTPDKTFEDSD